MASDGIGYFGLRAAAGTLHVYGPAVLDKHAGDLLTVRDIAKGTDRVVILRGDPVRLGACDWELPVEPGTAV